jgi:predicted TPR repeat methyltransferase
MAAAVRLATAREKATIRPNDLALSIAYGEALMKADMPAEAVAEFQRALRLDYTSVEARFGLARGCLAIGEPEKALDALRQLDDGTPDVAAAVEQAHAMIARPRSDPDYIRHLFDSFSTNYDTQMVGRLAYRGPEILRELAEMVMPGRDRLAILDLGCGTGLTGAVFKDKAARLDGVDLSPAMIAKARLRGLYDRLAVGDIEAMPQPQDPPYDLLVAADTLLYLGDLTKVLAAAHARLGPGGFFLFTVERKEGDGFALGPKRRWHHSEVYLRAETARAGFDLAGCVACTPRSEAHAPVDGLAVALSRPA